MPQLHRLEVSAQTFMRTGIAQRIETDFFNFLSVFISQTRVIGVLFFLAAESLLILICESVAVIFGNRPCALCF